MSASDFATSRLSGDGDEVGLYDAAASLVGSGYTRLARSKSSVYAIDSPTRPTLELVKLEVKGPPAGRSGLLAAQLKGYALWQQHS